VTKKKQTPTKKPERILYVEGGGDHNSSLRSECRRAFSLMFQKAGITEKPAVRPMGGRQQAYEAFCNELAIDENHTWLLVDAEELAPALKPGDSADPWAHVKARDQWDRPRGATDEQLHLMNVTMETWLLCDRKALRKTFGPKINENKLPLVNSSLEALSKEVINQALNDALKETSAKKYNKGYHSFKILADVDPIQLHRTLFWADRLLRELGAPIITEGSAPSASRQPDPGTSP